MKIFTSYFYKVRFFKPYMIPVSTARFDPKWFHNFKNQDYKFIDKNGVINGLRAEGLAPAKEICGICGLECKGKAEGGCEFLTKYRQQLDTINFEEFMKNAESLCRSVQNKLCFEEEPVLVLLVHEAISNPCSERGTIQRWFREHGVECNEFDV